MGFFDETEHDLNGERPEVPESIPRHGRNGRPKIRHADDPTRMSYWPRASSFGDRVEDTFKLDQHNDRHIVKGLALSRDLIELAQGAIVLQYPADDAERQRVERAEKVELDRLAGVAKDRAGANAKAHSGTALHRLRERRDAGEDLAFVGPRMWAALEAYSRLMEPFIVYASEVFVACDRWQTAGTFDILGGLQPGYVMATPDGTLIDSTTRRILDLKGGNHIDELGRIARSAQLTIYPNGQPYVHVPDEDAADGDNGRLPWPGGIAPATDWALIPHVPIEHPEDAALWWVNLEEGAEIADHAARREQLRSLRPVTPAEPPQLEVPEPPRERIEVAAPAPRNEMWRTCSDCNYDTHVCQGCGEPVTHEQGRECTACRELHSRSVVEVDTHESILWLVRNAASEDDLTATWEMYEAAWTDAHTTAAQKRLAQLSNGSTEVRTS